MCYLVHEYGFQLDLGEFFKKARGQKYNGVPESADKWGTHAIS